MAFVEAQRPVSNKKHIGHEESMLMSIPSYSNVQSLSEYFPNLLMKDDEISLHACGIPSTIKAEISKPPKKRKRFCGLKKIFTSFSNSKTRAASRASGSVEQEGSSLEHNITHPHVKSLSEDFAKLSTDEKEKSSHPCVASPTIDSDSSKPPKKRKCFRRIFPSFSKSKSYSAPSRTVKAENSSYKKEKCRKVKKPCSLNKIFSCFSISDRDDSSSQQTPSPRSPSDENVVNNHLEEENTLDSSCLAMELSAISLSDISSDSLSIRLNHHPAENGYISVCNRILQSSYNSAQKEKRALMTEIRLHPDWRRVPWRYYFGWTDSHQQLFQQLQQQMKPGDSIYYNSTEDYDAAQENWRNHIKDSTFLSGPSVTSVIDMLDVIREMNRIRSQISPSRKPSVH